MNAPIPSQPRCVLPDPLFDTHLANLRALRDELAQLTDLLEYFMRHELAEMHAKAEYFNLLCSLSARRAASRTARV